MAAHAGHQLIRLLGRKKLHELQWPWHAALIVSPQIIDQAPYMRTAQSLHEPPANSASPISAQGRSFSLLID